MSGSGLRSPSTKIVPVGEITEEGSERPDEHPHDDAPEAVAEAEAETGAVGNAESPTTGDEVASHREKNDSAAKKGAPRQLTIDF